ncbi:EF-hand domain-containing protein [Caulobacter segnis]|uniref:EF-hand domain-containing protein n=1 Tax=Caulobacter segnis TaxID=88688 RepID=UPI001CBD0A89|nr:EF-hand domain-containing protein [Caulobacter segnis]UAL09539.1 EF-hand domain-containing protein [Caulobacter segnis]
MTRRTLIAAGLMAGLAGPVLAQTTAPAAPAGMTLQQFQAKNGDKLFTRLDTNKDGKISPAEFTAFRKENAEADAKATKAGKRGQKLFSRFDKDKDGSLSRTEADALLAWRFKRMDANADGILSLEELQAKSGKAKVGV